MYKHSQGFVQMYTDYVSVFINNTLLCTTKQNKKKKSKTILEQMHINITLWHKVLFRRAN